MKIEKTNAMRILDQKKVNYQVHSYMGTEAISGVEVAEVLGQNPKQVFKTLVKTTEDNYDKVNRYYDLKRRALDLDILNRYDVNKSFGSQWVEEEDGGVSFYGATTISYLAPNGSLSKKMFKKLKWQIVYTFY